MTKIQNLPKRSKSAQNSQEKVQFTETEMAKMEALEASFEIPDVRKQTISMNYKGSLNPKSLVRLEKIRGRKFSSTAIVNALINEAIWCDDKDMLKYYKRALTCCDRIRINEIGNFISRYCNTNCCIVCLNNKTGRKIFEYKEALEGLKDAQFLTLTWGRRLPGTWNAILEQLNAMKKTLRRAYENIRLRHKRSKGKWPKLRGMPKFELTVEEDLSIHLHLHVIVEGCQNAEYIKKYWNKAACKATGITWEKKHKGKIEDVNEGSMIELLKYTTKMVSSSKKKDKNGKKKPDKIYIQGLHQVFKALYRKKTVTGWNLEKKVNDYETGFRTSIVKYGDHDDQKHTWCDEDGKCLTPTEIEQWRKDKIKDIVTGF